MEVLLEGALDKCASADSDLGRKEWKRRHFVLKHLLASDVRCLEYYKDKNWRCGKHDPKGVLYLYPGFDVVKVHDPKRKFVFDIKTVEHTFRLAASSVDSMNQWMHALEKANTVKSFSVEVEPVEQLKKLGAKGLCYLHITDRELRLVAAADGHLLVVWPFKCLRRYMSSHGKFTIEAGRRAPTGEGVFTFYSAAHDDMYKLLDSVVKSKASKVQAVPPVHDDHKPVMAASPMTPQAGGTVSDDRYVHLMSGDVPLPSHHPHPNYNHGISSTKGAGPREPRYASPYGHLAGTSAVCSTVGQASSPTSPSEMSKARGSISDQNYDILSALHQGGHGEEDTYNVLNNSSGPPSPSVGGTETVDTEDTYSVLDHDMLKGGTIPPQGGVWDPNVGTDNMYNILGHQQNSPIKTNAANVPFKSAYDETAYDSLSPVHAHKPPLVKSWEGPSQEKGHMSLDHRQSLQQADRSRIGRVSGSIDDNTYNTLSHNTLPGNQLHPPKSGDSTNTYNTLDHNKIHSSLTKPVSPVGPQVSERCPVVKESSEITRVGSVSIPGTDLTRSSFSSNRSTPVSHSDFDSYSSLDYTSMSPPVGKAPSLPFHRMSQKSNSPTKPRPPPPRKGSAPDILAHITYPEPRSPSKSNLKGGNLVSNLRASLEAGGFDLTKPKPKPRNLTAQLSQEESIPEVDADYAVVNNQEDIGLLKTGRSPSVPIEPCDDIYEEPDRPPPAPRPKSVPSGKAKKSHSKRF